MRSALALAVILALAACTAPGGGPRTPYARLLKPQADPGAVVAAEIAFARAAQEKGQWTAFAEYATPDAVMFAPEPVNAREWLKKQTEPGAAVKWQPHEVWSSCDGSIAVTRGAWQLPEGRTGMFTTVWQRQKGGGYKWVLDQGIPLDTPLTAPDFVATSVADCRAKDDPPPPPAPIAHYEAGARQGGGSANDLTLRWHWVHLPDNRRAFRASIYRSGAWQDIVVLDVPAPDSAP